MAVTKEELQKIGEDSFEPWFKKWVKKARVERKLRAAAKEGYNSISFVCCSNPHMQNDKFVGYLRNEFPSLTVERENYIYKKEKVKISWQN
ncbi:hypothetical protein MX630_04965 [Carnobacterium divergens]|uniref:hypothetical protein n=1 Tax=Carnobacterium divergens TaxID=2748 RepID=UPI0028921D86|nr:hypothetical protein [Carnobacterium divergens]MDT1950093.1 hypothetical protein [Carnobacterium divergens]MDT1955271.1 hypothetical protein [Carnobacterium divergens]MDT1960509.1 hypothetical protein [Carnobacterium divergens]MDT1963053.1 hypothetical protein [Carnobacterium divergens]